MTLQSKKLPGRPRKHLSSTAGLLSSGALPPPDHDSTAHIKADDSSINMEHLQIFHHYSISTCKSLSSDPSATEMFRVELPQMANEQPFIMHLIMALSSRHLQFLTSEKSKKTHYANFAENQFSAALPKLRQSLAHLDEKSSQALYISSLLVCWYVFARGPSPGDYLLFSDDVPLIWFPLLRGVRHIRELGHSDSSSNTAASPNSGVQFPKADGPVVNSGNTKRVNWETHFREFTAFVASTAPATCVEIYLVALTRLKRHYEATYGDDENGSYNGNKVHQMIFQWLYLMEEDFIDRVQRRNPHALLIVANFSVLLSTYDSLGCWFLRGWGKHILNGIYNSLESNYQSWMRWPMEAADIDWSALSP
ncbi:unnamed protein product [Penicillium olsonii]|nr:unnamed protein product [Penicillium olsonii]